ncbi:MAG: hypothetical protein HY718_00210 [Planctomycetes bacterium]|nr:hypothetical protein [Planctomycetota bacterium]
MPFTAVCLRLAACSVLAMAFVLLAAPPAIADFDHSRYMAPNELQPGMKGYGRTVLSGTKIETFQIEIISVMSNVFYAKQDVILVRCSGLNLEHSGIIGGMSGSPCYIKDAAGRDRMIGAVAYGWQFSKEPICGVQPITQMIDIPKVRDPARRSGPHTRPATSSAAASAGRLEIGQLIARVWNKPIDPACCFSIFNDDLARLAPTEPPAGRLPGLEPLKAPLLISGGGRPQVIAFLKEVLSQSGLEPIAGGAPSAASRAQAGDVRLEPGSVLCVPLAMGDLNADALGTCTEVDGDRILGFGHSLDAQGSIELPLATGMVHTVIPSLLRSNKMGGSLQTVGTLWGDESTGIFGTVGKAPAMVPVNVTVEEARGQTSYHISLAYDETIAAGLLAGSIMEAVYAHSEPPREHTVRYQLEVEFADLGRFQAANVTSQAGVFGLGMAAMIPTATLLNSPFGETRLTRARVNIKIEEGAHLAQIEQALLDRQVYRPGDTVNVRVRLAHYRDSPTFTEETYSLKLPDDLNDGDYPLGVGGTRMHMTALRSEKPHLFRAENLPELLERFNQTAAVPDNRLFLRLAVPRGGLAIKSTELPDLPAYRAQLYTGSKRSDVQPYREALVKEYEVPFVVDGGQTLSVTVNRRADQ